MNSIYLLMLLGWMPNNLSTFIYVDGRFTKVYNLNGVGDVDCFCGYYFRTKSQWKRREQNQSTHSAPGLCKLASGSLGKVSGPICCFSCKNTIISPKVWPVENCWNCFFLFLQFSLSFVCYKCIWSTAIFWKHLVLGHLLMMLEFMPGLLEPKFGSSLGNIVRTV